MAFVENPLAPSTRWASRAPFGINREPLVLANQNQPYLYQWGAIQFLVQPLNIHELDHSTATDWAKKPIVGAAIYREWVGENDEEIYFKGNLFPFRIGGLADLEAVETMRRSGLSNLLMRGDGRYMGWYVIERIVRNHTFLSINGIGQLIGFEAIFVRVPIPEADSFYSGVWAGAGA